jgi:hypothetical protein
VTTGRKRGRIRRRGWLHRASHHEAEQFEASSDAAGADPGNGEGGSGERQSGGHGDVRDSGGGGSATGPDTQASLDQVLRTAAEARDKEGSKDGAA